jgi:hypothetical protein
MLSRSPRVSWVVSLVTGNDAAFEAYRCDQIHRAVADAYLRDHTAAETAE